LRKFNGKLQQLTIEGPETKKQATIQPKSRNVRAKIPKHKKRQHSTILAHQRVELAAHALAEVRANRQKP
jgi:hypothetical protein